MAADKLVAAGKAAGVDIHVETQGSSGSTPLDPALIRAADAVIFAVDVGVRDQDRFAGKPVVQSRHQAGDQRARRHDPRGARRRGRPERPPRGRHGAAGGRAPPRSGGGASTGTEVRRWLLTGVSYMIPFVAAGGLLIALGFLLRRLPDRSTPNPDVEGQSYALSWVLEQLPVRPADGDGHRGPQRRLPAATSARSVTVLGQAAFGFLVPALAGYIAYAIADRPGIAPGFVVGAVSVDVGAGFIGGLIGGIIAGFARCGSAGWKLPAGRARPACRS